MRTKKITFLGILVGYSLALYILETYIPNPLIAIFPGAKLGLSNIITLICLLSIGIKDTIIVITIRVILSTIFSGPVSYLLFSIGGAYLSLIFMYLAIYIRNISEITISILGAIGHNIGQLLVASIIINNINIIGYLPFMLITSLITGVFIGITACYTRLKIEKLIVKFIDKN